MTYSPFLLVHIIGGMIGFLSGTVALVARKGARLHRWSGDVFVVSMLVMSASGASLALMRSQRFNFLGGVLTFYLVATAWLTLQRKEKERRLAEIGLLLAVLAVGVSSLAFRWEAAHRAAGKGGSATTGYAVFACVALLFAAADVRMLLRARISGVQRLVRHLWRMGFALFIAAGSFFLGRASDPVLRRIGLRARLFTDAVRQTHLPEVPVLLVVVLTIFWLWRVRFSKTYRHE
jgi:uncharacterized membrane protein